ncbi:MAG TPA: TPM domain-containing protein [Nitrospiraceae bacterium]|nr:TPM domain-containing protein [Nitrospiraceae bacterium]
MSKPLVISTLCLAWLSVAIALDVPPLTGRIVDLAGLLPPDMESALSSELAAHEQRTGNQVALLTLPTLEGESLEDYAHRVATSWKLGQKGTDNGVLLLVVPRERRIRIEVGYGLEGTLTDAVSARIIRHVIVPRFRSGDFAEGISAGLKAILGTIEGTATPVESAHPGNSASGGAFSVFVTAVILGALIGVMVGRSLRVLAGGVSGLLSFFLAMPSGVYLALAAGAVGMVVAFVLAALSGAGRRGGRGWDGGWGPGWGGGYGGGGFPSSSDSFSGGGGDFGGGGASGRW